MTIEQPINVVVESTSAPPNPRLAKVLSIGCKTLTIVPDEEQNFKFKLTDAPCAAAIAYGSKPNTVYVYTNKPRSSFGLASSSMVNMTETMTSEYADFYEKMSSTMGYGNCYSYTYNGSMQLEQLMGTMNMRSYTGSIGTEWHTSMMNMEKGYPYLSASDMMVLVKVHS